jgi:uncharacterized protein DUF2252
MRSIVKSTDAYEAWMRERTDVSDKLLEKKHRKMRDGAFPFLRATFYRWIEQWPAICAKLARRQQDVVLAVGDLHVENFGVWRDAQQRSVWGVNDFDDACELPFTSDLVRLATSAMLAAAAAKIAVTADTVCGFVLDGYVTGLVKAEPIVIPANGKGPLAKLTRDTQEKSEEFWPKKLDPEENPEVDRRDLPEGLEDMFRASFRANGRATFRKQKSPGGLGSLGRRRFTAVETLEKGVYDAREAKALVPSALYWFRQQHDMPSQTATLLQHAIRIPDPYFQVHDRWLIRQLAPDVAKIEMPEDPADKRLALAPALLRLMGQETANIHLGSFSRADLEKRLKELERNERWFAAATERMIASTRSDYAAWDQYYSGHKKTGMSA